MSSRLTSRLALASLLGLTVGCSESNWLHGGSTAPPAPTPAVATPTPVVDAPSPDALAAKVNTYANDVAPQLNRGAGKSASATPAATQPDASALPQIKWLTPDSLRLGATSVDASGPAIQPTAAASASAQTTSASGDANFPVTVPEGVDAAPAAVNASATDFAIHGTDQIDHQLARHLRDYPTDLDGQLSYELLMFIEGQPVPQMSALAGLRPEDRELMSALMDGLSNFRSVVRSGDNLLLASKVKPLLDMDDRLRGQSELTLPTVTLCNEVKSYGVYKAIDANRFIAGRENQVIVYCEVQNFQSRLTPGNQWQTQLSQEMVLYTETGLPVWPAKSQPQPVTDLCHQRRHDFFIARLVTLPANLTIGRYLLKITVTDPQANHVAEATVPVEIVAE